MQPTPPRFGASVLALMGLLGAAGLAFAPWPRQAPAAQPSAQLTAAIQPSGLQTTPKPSEPATPLGSAEAAPLARTAFEQLHALQIENETSRENRELKLYDRDGQIDEAAARQLDELLCDARDPKDHETTRLNRRTLQLLFKAAYHFESYEVEVVSAYRKPGSAAERGRTEPATPSIFGCEA